MYKYQRQQKTVQRGHQVEIKNSDRPEVTGFDLVH